MNIEEAGADMGVGTGSDAKDGLDDEAIGWLVRVQSDAATADDWAALATWLEGSDARLAAFERAEAMALDLDAQAPAIRAALQATGATVVPFRPRSPRPARMAWAAAAATAACLVAAVAAGPWLLTSSGGALQTYRTERGQTLQVALADGSHITLDSASSLSVRLGWRTRRVSLGEGQASFDVAKDAHRPFVIAVGDQRVRVVGTEFDIRHFDRAIVVSVRRGVVEVSQPSLGAQPVARLTRGESLTHNEGAPSSATRIVDPDLAFAWTQGRMVCSDQPLPELVADLNRRFSTPIRLSDRAAKLHFTGVLAIGDETDAVRRLAAFLSLHIERSRSGIVLD